MPGPRRRQPAPQPPASARVAESPDVPASAGSIPASGVRYDADELFPDCERLSVREREALELMADGKTNKDIATVFGNSTRTVENQVSRLFRKLHVNDRGEATALYYNAIQEKLLRKNAQLAARVARWSERSLSCAACSAAAHERSPPNERPPFRHTLEWSCHVVRRFCHTADSFPGLPDSFCHTASSSYRMAEPFCHVPEPFCHVAEPFCHARQPSCHVVKPFCHTAEPSCHAVFAHFHPKTTEKQQKDPITWPNPTTSNQTTTPSAPS